MKSGRIKERGIVLDRLEITPGAKSVAQFPEISNRWEVPDLETKKLNCHVIGERDSDRLECYGELKHKIARVKRQLKDLKEQYNADVETVLASNWRIGDEYIYRVNPENLVIRYVDTERRLQALLESLEQRYQSYTDWLRKHQYGPLTEQDKLAKIKEIERTVPVKFRF